MVEADSQLKLLPTSALDMHKVFGHIHMLSMGIRYQSYTVIPTLFCSDFGVLGHLRSENDVITSWLRLTATGMVQANVGQKLVKSNLLQVFLMTDDKFWTLHLEIQMKYRIHLSICYSASLTLPTNYMLTLVKPFSFVL